MARPLLPDALWAIIEPLLPKHAPSPKGGRPRISDRRALTGILFVLETGLPWEDLPAEMNCGGGMSCWRLAARPADGTWEKTHAALPARPDAAGKLDGSKAVIDSPSVRAVSGGAAVGPNPTDRGKSGSKHHVLTDGRGTPLACRVSAANVHDVRLRPATVVAGPLPGYGGPGRLPERLLADRGYDSRPHEDLIRWMGIEPVFAQQRTGHGSGLGRRRYVVERAIAALHQNRRLKVRYERRADVHQAFLTLARIKVCWYRLAGQVSLGFLKLYALEAIALFATSRLFGVPTIRSEPVTCRVDQAPCAGTHLYRSRPEAVC